MSWKKSGGIDYSRYSNNITSNQSNFNYIETLKINKNNTLLHVGSNTLRVGNNTGLSEQINSVWFGGLDLNDYNEESVTLIPRTSLEELYYRSEYVEGTKKELFIFKGNDEKDRIRFKSSNIAFDTYSGTQSAEYPTDRYEENIRMIINEDGKIGINTLTPRSTLDIKGKLLSEYGSGLMGNGMTNQTTGKVNPLITNGYFYCGKLDIAFEVSNNQSLNNSKLKVEVFGGELAGVNGFGVDTYVISNNAINQTNNEQNNNLSALIFKSSICGGAGLGNNNDLYSLSIFRCADGTDDVYIYVKGYQGTTLSIRSFLLSNYNYSNESMQEQDVVLQYSSTDGSVTPSTDENIVRTPVYGVDTANTTFNIKYGLNIGVVERYDNKVGFGTDVFPSDTNYGPITGITNYSFNGNTLMKGNAKINENLYIDKDLTVFGKLYLNGEMQVNSVVMQNYNILESSSIGGGLTMDSDQLQSVPNQPPVTQYNQNHIIFDNSQGSKETTQFSIYQRDEYVGEVKVLLPGYANITDGNEIMIASDDLIGSVDVTDTIYLNINNDVNNQAKFTVTNIDGLNVTISPVPTVTMEYVQVSKVTLENGQYNFFTMGRSLDNWETEADISVDGNTGYVGIGTTTPKNKLDIMGSLCLGSDYVNVYTAPENGALIEGSVGIGVSNFIQNSSTKTLCVGGSCVIGNFLSSTYPAYPNGMLVQNAVGIGVIQPRSMLDVGGTIRFGDGSVQSTSANFLGSKTNGIWDKMGTFFGESDFNMNNDVYKPITNDTIGTYVVDCNNDGSIIYVGTPISTVENIGNVGNVTAYRWCNKQWCIMGETMVGDVSSAIQNSYTGEQFGTSISVDGTGHTIIIGSPLASKIDETTGSGLQNCGKISIYKWQNSDWTNVYTYYGNTSNMYLGQTVKVNKNGDTFLVGGRGLNYIYCIHNELVNFQYTNEYQVDSIDKTTGEISTENNYGSSLDLNREGTVIAVGCSNENVTVGSNTYNAGTVYMYLKRFNSEKNKLVFDSNYFIKINAPDPTNNQRFGSSVSLTSSGLRIAIGGPNFTNETNTSIGIVAVYSLNSNIFDDNLVESSDNTDKISLLDTISGSYLNEYFGSSLSLNGSGDYLIVGSTGTTTQGGKISMFNYSNTNEWSKYTNDYLFTDLDLPTSTIATNSESTMVVVGYGQIFTTSNQNNIEVLHLGSYENTVVSEKINVIHNLGINNSNATQPIDIISESYQDIIQIKANYHPSTINSNGNTSVDYSSYLGGILINNDYNGGSQTTYYLNNNNVVFTNNSGGFSFNYNEKFELCNSSNTCTLHINEDFVGINNTNPVSNLDIIGKVKLVDGTTQNMLISNKAYSNTISGQYNIGLGHCAFETLSSGSNNTIIGYTSGKNITDGNYNTSLGSEALYDNVSGNYNVAIGANALENNLQNSNTALGYGSLKSATQGIGNTAIGSNTDVDTPNSGDHYNYSTAIGYNAIIGKSNSIILGDSTNSDLCVGIGVNSPQDTLHVVGNSLLDGELQINDICKPNGGLSINNNIGNMLSVDSDGNFLTQGTLTVGNNTTLNKVLIQNICNPQGGVNMLDDDDSTTVFRIKSKGFTQIGALNTSSSINNPLLTVNGYLLLNNSMNITGTLVCRQIQTNNLIFVDTFEPNGGLKMFNQVGSEVLCLEENTGSISTQGTLSVAGATSLTSMVLSSDATFHSTSNVTIEGKLLMPNSSQIVEGNVNISDGDTFIKIDNGITIDSSQSKDVLFDTGIPKITIKGDLEVDGNIEAKGGIVDTAAVIPIKGIIMFSGSEDEIPTNWAICDGNNGTPDLRGRFIMSSTYNNPVNFPTNNNNIQDTITTNTGDTGGYSKRDITVSDLPSHNHELEIEAHQHDFDFSHSHTMDKDLFNKSSEVIAYGQNYGPSGTSGSLELQQQNNTPLQPLANSTSGSNAMFNLSSVSAIEKGDSNSVLAITVPQSGAAAKATATPESAPVDQLGLYTNVQQLTSDPSTSIQPPDDETFKTAAVAPDITVANTGGNTQVDNQPQYYVLAFIMRIK